MKRYHLYFTLAFLGSLGFVATDSTIFSYSAVFFLGVACEIFFH